VALLIQVYTHNIGKTCGPILPLHEVLIIKVVATHIVCLFAVNKRGLFAVYLVGYCLRH
jgi:hypothetical protein